jgi:uncharacterized protein YfeS
MAVDAIMDSLQAIDDSGNRPDVALVALPVALIERVWNAKTDAEVPQNKKMQAALTLLIFGVPQGQGDAAQFPNPDHLGRRN